MAHDRLVASPVCDPQMGLRQALDLFGGLGFTKFEIFTTWTDAALDPQRPAGYYRDLFGQYGMRCVSVHLPPVRAGDADSLQAAIHTARLGDELGADVAIFEADSEPAYAEAAGPLLNALSGLRVRAALQNHANTPIATVEDYRRVLSAIDDPRMAAVLEVGHFHLVGESWREGARLLGERIALVHLKDIAAGECVPFGEGELDFPALLETMRRMGYTGDYVVELEGHCRSAPVHYLRDAADYLGQLLEE